jgi:hypothetical protein
VLVLIKVRSRAVKHCPTPYFNCSVKCWDRDNATLKTKDLILSGWSGHILVWLVTSHTGLAGHVT